MAAIVKKTFRTLGKAILILFILWILGSLMHKLVLRANKKAFAEFIRSEYIGVVVGKDLPARDGSLVVENFNHENLHIYFLSACLYTKAEVGDTVIKIRDKDLIIIRKLRRNKESALDTIQCD